jgi:hypothetical protein
MELTYRYWFERIGIRPLHVTLECGLNYGELGIHV